MTDTAIQAIQRSVAEDVAACAEEDFPANEEWPTDTSVGVAAVDDVKLQIYGRSHAVRGVLGYEKVQLIFKFECRVEREVEGQTIQVPQVIEWPGHLSLVDQRISQLPESLRDIARHRVREIWAVLFPPA